MRGNDQHLDFDLELAKSRTNDNPVYYIQYAHARVAQRAAPARASVAWPTTPRTGLASLAPADDAAGDRAAHAHEPLSGNHRAVRGADRAPHTLVHYLRDLANDFHT